MWAYYFEKIWNSEMSLAKTLTPNTRMLYTHSNVKVHQQSYLHHIHFIVFDIVWVYLTWLVTVSSLYMSMFSLRTDLCKFQLKKQHRYCVSLLALRSLPVRHRCISPHVYLSSIQKRTFRGPLEAAVALRYFPISLIKNFELTQLNTFLTEK